MKKQIRRVALLVPTATQWGRGVIEGVHNYVRKEGGLQLIVEARGEGEELMLPSGWDGDGVIARIQSQGMARALNRAGSPVVNVSRIRLAACEIPRVSTDLAAVVGVAVDHFLNRGFKNFAYFSLLRLTYVSDHRRAFVARLKSQGISCSVYSARGGRGGKVDWSANMDGVAEWLLSLPKPIGVFTWNPSSGRQLLQGAERAGLNVPEDVALLSGVDDDLLCELPGIPMSGIAGATQRIGHEAALLLNDLMRGKMAPKVPTLIPPLGVVTRQSTDTLAIPDRTVARAVRFIRENAGQPIQVQDIIDHVSVSRRSLERMFSRLLQRTPAQEIRRVHFERAKHLLEQTDLFEPDVAASSGYGSTEYMVYVFGKELGLTPLQYRRQVRSR